MLTPEQKAEITQKFHQTKDSLVAQFGEEAFQRNIASTGPEVLVDVLIEPFPGEVGQNAHTLRVQELLRANRDECIQLFAQLLGYC